MKKTSRVLKWVAGSFEVALGIPVLGGVMVIASMYSLLGLMLVIHIVGLVITVKARGIKTGHILGIIGSCVGFIPFVGMTFHILTAIMLMVEAANNGKRRATIQNQDHINITINNQGGN